MHYRCQFLTSPMQKRLDHSAMRRRRPQRCETHRLVVRRVFFKSRRFLQCVLDGVRLFDVGPFYFNKEQPRLSLSNKHVGQTFSKSAAQHASQLRPRRNQFLVFTSFWQRLFRPFYSAQRRPLCRHAHDLQPRKSSTVKNKSESLRLAIGSSTSHLVAVSRSSARSSFRSSTRRRTCCDKRFC